MKSVMRAVLLGGLATLALSGVATASASAAECPGTGEGVVLCSGGHVQEGTFEFTGSQKSVYLKAAGLEGRVECGTHKTRGDYVGTSSHLEVAHLYWEWSKCSYSTNKSCTVREPIVWDGANGTGSGPGLKGTLSGTGKITLSSPSGEYLTEIRITGCEQAYQMKISGQQKCELPSSTSEAATHEMVCLVSGSALKWGAREVSFEGYETFGLSSGKQFSLQKS